MARLLHFVALGVVACINLDVANVTQPDIDNVFATPSSIEQSISGGMQSCQNALHPLTPADGELLPQLAGLSLEGYAVLMNFGIGVRVGIPRAPVVNEPGSPPIYGDFARLSTGGRLAANTVNALDRLTAGGGTLGTEGQNARARAFGFLAVACHQAWLGMLFDSAGVVTPGMTRDSIPPLAGSGEVMRSAIAMLDSAVAIALLPVASGSAGFPIPATWFGGNSLSVDGFVRLARSLRARFRAGVARTPVGRDSVNWSLVVADAENGLSSDLLVGVGGSTGWNPGSNINATLFHSMAPHFYGMGDVSGGYDSWLALPLEQRGFFLIVTPDRRWPQGATRAAQQMSSANAGSALNATPYIANRTGADISAHPWGVSYYFFNRLQYIRNAGSSGAYPALTQAELRLLAAEGYLRGGNVSAAAALIDVTRVGRGQLPALSGALTSAAQPVPGGAQCVPRVPVGPTFTTTTCGTIWEALKWEKRMETAYTGYGQWYFDSRGWGDLIEGTATEFPVPYQELDARRRPYYSLGGGLKSSARRGTYGF